MSPASAGLMDDFMGCCLVVVFMVRWLVGFVVGKGLLRRGLDLFVAEDGERVLRHGDSEAFLAVHQEILNFEQRSVLGGNVEGLFNGHRGAP